MPTDDEAPLLSRSGRTSVYGGRNDRVSALVSRDVKDEITRRRGAVGLTESEWLSTFLEVHLFGIAHADRLQRERLKAIAGIDTEEGAPAGIGGATR